MSTVEAWAASLTRKGIITMTTETPIDLDALERIAQAVLPELPNPWLEDGDGIVLHPDEPGNSWDGYIVCEVPADGYRRRPVRAHIAAFDPPTALALIARVRELEAIVNDGGNQAAKYWTRLTAAEREREAEHRRAEAHREAFLNASKERFEYASARDAFHDKALDAIHAMNRAQDERDRYRGAMEEALERIHPEDEMIRPILTRALYDKDAEK